MTLQLFRDIRILTLAGILLLGTFCRVEAMPAASWSSVRHETIRDVVGNTAGLNGSRAYRIIGESVPMRGTVRLLAIPVEFAPDTDKKTSGRGTFPYTTWGPATDLNYLQTRLNRVSQFFSEASGNRVALQTYLAAKVTLPNTMATYSALMNSNDPSDASRMAREVIGLCDETVDFSPYDIVMFIHAGCGQEMALNSDSLDIWSHYMKVSAGGAVPTSDGVMVGAWAVVPETQCHDSFFLAANPGLNILTYEMSKNVAPNAFVPHYWDVVGVWAHELGHAFGMPDMYDTAYDSGVELGDWSLMSNGSYLPGPDPVTEPNATLVPYNPTRVLFGSVPSMPDAWNRQLMGWTSVINVTGRLSNEKMLPQGASTGFVYRLWRNGDTSSSEYFLVENRTRVGYDTYLPEGGLMVYHVDDTVGSISANDMQINRSHPRVMPVSADNELEVEIVSINPLKIVYVPAENTAFPSTLAVTHVGMETTPSTKSYSNSVSSYVDINNIKQVGNYIYADLQTAMPTAITFENPLPGSVLYITKPTLRALAPNMLPSSLTVSLNGARLNDVTYNEETGAVTASLGSLSTGTYALVISAQDKFLANEVSATATFTIREKALSRGMQMISLPAVGIGTASDVFTGQTALKLARWNPLTGTYLRYPDAAVELTSQIGAASERENQLAKVPPAGKGYWINLIDPCSLRLNGDLVENNKQYAVPLYAGFNMIGVPYSYAVAFGSLLVEKDGVVSSISEAVEKHIVDPVLYTWNGTSYTMAILPAGELKPWVGYWLYSNAGTSTNPVRLIFQPTPSQGTAYSTTTRTGGDAAAWEMRITATSQQDGTQALVILGVGAGATAQIDPGVDLYQPPMALQGIGMGVVAGRASLLRDYRSPIENGTATWDIEVTGAAGSTVTLSWADLTGVPQGMAVVLTDTVTGEARYLRTTSNYTLTLGPQETRRRLTMTVTPGMTGTLQLTGLTATRTRGARSVSITGQLTAPAQVQAEIRTLTGKLLRRLTTTTRSQGTVQLTWDGTNFGGQVLPRGTYQCQVIATANNGQTVKAVILLPQ